MKNIKTFKTCYILQHIFCFFIILIESVAQKQNQHRMGNLTNTKYFLVTKTKKKTEKETNHIHNYELPISTIFESFFLFKRNKKVVVK